MADQIVYTVHSCVEDEVAVIAKLDGHDVEAKVKCLVVEGISSDGAMSHTFKLRGSKAEDYPVGSEFTASLKPGK